MITVYLLNTENITENDVNTDIKNQGYKSVNSYIAYSFLNAVATNILNTDSANLTIETTANGKPYFKNTENFYFSISHTKNVVAIAVSNNEIGVDVELIRNVDLKIIDRFFTENEKEYIIASPDFAKERFFEIWTKKEAYIKQKGLNLSYLSAVDVTVKSIDKHFYTFKSNGCFVAVYSENSEKPEIISLNRSQVLDIITNQQYKS